MQFRNRASGTTIEVSTADQAGCDPEGGPWVAICRDHGAILNVATRSRAISAGRRPDFCSECSERMSC